MNNATVIYYSSNREHPAFEQEIERRLLALIGDMPLISVTQQQCPHLGHNICVGDVGVSQHNCKRQIQIGCEAAQTEWVVMAESDFIYSPDYFSSFDASAADRYTGYFYRPVYICWRRGASIYSTEKQQSEGALWSSREMVLRESKREMDDKNKPLWIDTMEKRMWDKPLTFKCSRSRWAQFWGQTPVLTFKTGRGMHNQYLSQKGARTELPYFGPICQFAELLRHG